MTTHEFVPTRLEFARKRRGIPRTKLAELVGLAPKTIQRWESGLGEPSEDQMVTLAQQLRVLPSFFCAYEIDLLPDAAVSFRALTKMSASERDAATAAGRLGVEVIRWIEGMFKLPDHDIPSLTGWTPELAADAVRERWDLGRGPVRHLVATCELHGIRVLAVAPDYRSVDAFSFYDAGTPFIFLNTSKTAERIRFDLAHELGHLALHGEHECPQGRKAEQEANDFASAFLMPRDSILAAGLVNASVEDIIRVKSRWQVSAMALARRLEALGLVTDWVYRSICIELSKRGFRSREPGSQLVPESSQVLRKVLTALRTDNLSARKIASQFGLPLVEFNSYLSGLVVVAEDGAGGGGPPTRPKLQVLRGGGHT
jgi:Zn-dependent peptidase ImmA (M78 family)/transcriptional regulator with XRE-family HTH domain